MSEIEAVEARLAADGWEKNANGAWEPLHRGPGLIGEEQFAAFDAAVARMQEEEPDMTEAEIYEALGMQHPDDFALEAIRRNVSVEIVNSMGWANAMKSVWRCTGNTTRMLVGALERLVNDRDCCAYISGDDDTASDKLVKQARGWASELGVEPLRVVALHRAERPLSPGTVFVDGYSHHPSRGYWKLGDE